MQTVKMVVTGPFSAGKTEFIQSVSEIDVVSTERKISSNAERSVKEATTVAMDFGNIHGKTFDITLYGTPGHTRFDPLIPSLLHHAMGVVVVIDATKPATFSRARDLIGLLAKEWIPVVIAANKYDMKGAVDEQGIRSSLGIPGDTPLFFISAQKKADTHRVLKSMVDHITRFSY